MCFRITVRRDSTRGIIKLGSIFLSVWKLFDSPTNEVAFLLLQTKYFKSELYSRCLKFGLRWSHSGYPTQLDDFLVVD